VKCGRYHIEVDWRGEQSSGTATLEGGVFQAEDDGYVYRGNLTTADVKVVMNLIRFSRKKGDQDPESGDSMTLEGTYSGDKFDLKSNFKDRASKPVVISGSWLADS
jgi:T3SS negative regulator,GrlR